MVLYVGVGHAGFAYERGVGGCHEGVGARGDDIPGPPDADRPGPTAIGLVGGLFDLIADWLLDADPHDPAHVEALITNLTEFYRTVRSGVRTPR